jgi:hypothetical protein
MMISIFATVPPPTLSTHTRIVAIILAIFFTSFVLEMIRQHRLQERYSVIWLIAGVAMIVGAVIPDTLGLLAQVMGVSDTNAALFSLILLVLLALSLHLTATVSRHSEQITRLAQELAMERARHLPIGDSAQASEHAGPSAPAAEPADTSSPAAVIMAPDHGQNV